MAVKLALNSKEDYNLDQEVGSFPLKMFCLSTFYKTIHPNLSYFNLLFYLDPFVCFRFFIFIYLNTS